MPFAERIERCGRSATGNARGVQVRGASALDCDSLRVPSKRIGPQPKNALQTAPSPTRRRCKPLKFPV